jgi:hypothetical protein
MTFFDTIKPLIVLFGSFIAAIILVSIRERLRHGGKN